jgi:hypothetical protein
MLSTSMSIVIILTYYQLFSEIVIGLLTEYMPLRTRARPHACKKKIVAGGRQK